MQKCKPPKAPEVLYETRALEHILRTDDALLGLGRASLDRLLLIAPPLPVEFRQLLSVLRSGLSSLEGSRARQHSILASVELAISGAHETAATDFPECVAIGDSAGFHCSGVRLNSKWILTSEHCTGATQMFIGTNVNDNTTGMAYALKSGGGLKNGQLRLYEIDDMAAPAVSPATLAVNCTIDENTMMAAASFGGSDKSASSFGIQRCAIFQTSVSGGVKPTDTTFPAGAVYGSGICPGDSGAPLFIFNGNIRSLVAVSEEMGATIKQCSKGGEFTHITAAVADWLDRTADGPFTRACP